MASPYGDPQDLCFLVQLYKSDSWLANGEGASRTRSPARRQQAAEQEAAPAELAILSFLVVVVVDFEESVAT
jgi:hypothetical protein